MADRVTKEIRSYNMSKIKGKNTSIELKVRHYLFHHGFRYKINVKDYLELLIFIFLNIMLQFLLMAAFGITITTVN